MCDLGITELSNLNLSGAGQQHFDITKNNFLYVKKFFGKQGIEWITKGLIIIYLFY